MANTDATALGGIVMVAGPLFISGAVFSGSFVEWQWFAAAAFETVLGLAIWMIYR